MLALPGSLLWLFLLVYFSYGQILDKTTLDISNTSNKRLDNFETANHTNIYNEEEKENKTVKLLSDEEGPKPHPSELNPSNSSTNGTFKVDFDAPVKLNQTTSDSFGRNSRRRITNRTENGSRTTELPMMSQERRNSYLSIAERRKYYNRTRVQTKKPQLNDVELEYQESINKLLSTSTETVLVNEIRVIKKPINQEHPREVTTEKDQTSNQRSFNNFSNNETQGKPQSTRQSVIQSQYQFGQKLRKPVSRTQDSFPDEKSKRKKEKTKIELIMENSTNKFNKNYPTQSTKLIRVDKNLWPTTTIPQEDPDIENATTLEKMIQYIMSNETKTGAFSSKANNSEPLSTNEESNNHSKVPGTNSFTVLSLSNTNENTNETVGRNFSDGVENSSAVKDVYNQEILKLNNSKSNSSDVIYYAKTLSKEAVLDSFNNSTTVKTPTVSTIMDKLNQSYGKFQNQTQPTILKANTKWTSNTTAIPVVKAISRDSSNLTSRTRLSPNEASTKQPQPKEKSRNGSTENWSKTEEYPLTIELNENNKRVLSEMFQTPTTPSLRKAVKEETIVSHTKPHVPSDSTTTTTTTTPKPPTTSQPITSSINATIATTTENPQVVPPDDYQEDHKAQGTRYSTKFYISPKFNESKVIKVVEEEDENDEYIDIQSRSAGVAIYVLAAFGLVPLLLALIFGVKFITQRNQREYECESDSKSDVSGNESQIKESKRKKGSTNLKKSPSNVTTITLVTATKLPRVHHWETTEKQGNRNWEFPRNKLKLKTILGQGNFGQVWKAEAEDMPGHEGVTRLVAVKTVKEGATEKEHIEFIKELEIMQQIGSHSNIVTLLGCCTDQEPYYLIMEYVKYGKLLTYLRENRVNENYYNFSSNSEALTSRDLTVFAYCVARGMEYLASRGIIHRDLAARNVLVDHNKLCKIADFGMSRSVRDFENGQVYEERQQKGALPIRWMAPESLVYSVFTYKSDVWSFGILMWEIVTLGSTPYPNMGAREVMRKVRDGYRLERPSHCKPEFYRLISYCWAHDPNKRPDFSELRHELSNLLDNPTKDGSYVDLDRFAVDNSFPVSSKTNDFRLLERNDFKTLQKLGGWENKDWPDNAKKIRTKRGKNNGKGTVTLTGQGSFTVNSRILEKEFKII